MRYEMALALGLGLLVFAGSLAAQKAPTPQLIRDIRPGPQSSLPHNLTVVGSRLCFLADDGAHQTEWWTSDGSKDGTRLVKDVITNGHFMVIGDKQQAVVDGILYFAFVDDDAELWRTDCTAKGTYRVKDLHPGPRGSHPRELTAVGKQLFFVANGGRGFEVWKSDGTAKGTVPVRSAPEAPPPAKKGAGESEPAYTLSGKPSARQQAAITKAMSYAAQTIGSSGQPTKLTAVGDRVVYSFDDGSSGTEPWVSDGTDAGTKLLKETRPGKDSISPWHFQAAGRYVYFRSLTGSPQIELWRTDGTPEGTVLVKALPRELSDGGFEEASFGDSILFTVRKESSDQLWFSDGTEAGTRQIELSGVSYAGANDKGMFILNNPLEGREFGPAVLYELRDGKLQRITPLPKLTGWSLYSRIDAVPGRLFFFDSASGSRGRGIWTSDGTAEGTVKIGDFADVGRHGGNYFAAIGPRIYLTVAKTEGDVELWRLDF